MRCLFHLRGLRTCNLVHSVQEPSLPLAALAISVSVLTACLESQLCENTAELQIDTEWSPHKLCITTQPTCAALSQAIPVSAPCVSSQLGEKAKMWANLVHRVYKLQMNSPSAHHNSVPPC